MIENFTPAGVATTVNVDGRWPLVIGWSNTADGLRPVVVDRDQPSYPRVVVEPVKYGDPYLAVTIDDLPTICADVSTDPDEPIRVRNV